MTKMTRDSNFTEGTKKIREGLEQLKKKVNLREITRKQLVKEVIALWREFTKLRGQLDKNSELDDLNETIQCFREFQNEVPFLKKAI